MPDGIDQKVLQVLVHHVGNDNRIRRDRLVHAVFKYSDGKPKQLSTLDRQVRVSIANMQEQGIPILSDSGLGGYWLGTRQECIEYIIEQQRRTSSLNRKINGIKKIWKIGDSEMQPSLFGMDRQ